MATVIYALAGDVAKLLRSDRLFVGRAVLPGHSLVVTSLARANGNTFFDGNGIGYITTEGPASTNQSLCANLAFTADQNASPTLATQTLLDFTFLGGNIAPASISSGGPSNPAAAPLTLSATSIATTPEPVLLLPVGLLLIGLSALRFRGRKSVSASRS